MSELYDCRNAFANALEDRKNSSPGKNRSVKLPQPAKPIARYKHRITPQVILPDGGQDRILLRVIICNPGTVLIMLDKAAAKIIIILDRLSLLIAPTT